MPFSSTQIAQVAQRVASQVRQQIPRSSNRYLDGDTSTDWLHDEAKIEYTKFLQVIARVDAEGSAQSGIQLKKPAYACMFTKNTSKAASISDLKKAVRAFLKDGRIDGKPVDLRYRPTLKDEEEYSKKFGTALADYLNKLGYRKGKEQKKFEGRRVMWDVSLELAVFDRGMKARSAPSLPLGYIRASALNASKFGVGNCEECGCAAFATLLTLTTIDNKPVGEEKIRIELVYGRTNSDAHFFVILNRSGALDIAADLDRWLADPSVVVCDPWIVDRGVGGAMTSKKAGVQTLREWLKPDTGESMEVLSVRASGYIGQSDGLKQHENFVLSASL